MSGPLALFAQQLPPGFEPPGLEQPGERVLQLPPVEYSAILPVLILVGGALLILLWHSLVQRRTAPGGWALGTILTSAGALVATGFLWDRVQDEGRVQLAFADTIALDGYSVFFMGLLSLCVALFALIADPYLRREGLDGPEPYVLALLSAAGGILMAQANDLLVLFLGLEVLSIALYVLAGTHRRRAESGEAAIKYFLLGSFASAFLLYGIALTYGATGSTNMLSIAEFLAANVVTSNGLLLAGAAFLLVGLGFKVAAVPFHAWTPDVYQGSPTPVTGFMAAAAKAAGFAGLLRVFTSAFSILEVDWRPLVWALAVLTLLVGAVLAVVQTDVKRMLAYSSINHAGFVLLGLEAASPDGIAGSLFYLLAYAFMVFGSFAIVTLVGGRGDERHDLGDYRGLAARRPALALAFTIFLLAQAGAPFTTGFLAKFGVISAAVDSGSHVLALIAMLASAIAAFFYLRLVVVMYGGGTGDAADSPAGDAAGAAAPPVVARAPLGIRAVIGIAAAFTLVFGVLPQPVLEMARDATPIF